MPYLPIYIDPTLKKTITIPITGPAFAILLQHDKIPIDQTKNLADVVAQLFVDNIKPTGNGMLYNNGPLEKSFKTVLQNNVNKHVALSNTSSATITMFKDVADINLPNNLTNITLLSLRNLFTNSTTFVKNGEQSIGPKDPNTPIQILKSNIAVITFSVDTSISSIPVYSAGLYLAGSDLTPPETLVTPGVDIPTSQPKPTTQDINPSVVVYNIFSAFDTNTKQALSNKVPVDTLRDIMSKGIVFTGTSSNSTDRITDTDISSKFKTLVDNKTFKDIKDSNVSYSFYTTNAGLKICVFADENSVKYATDLSSASAPSWYADLKQGDRVVLLPKNIHFVLGNMNGMSSSGVPASWIKYI